MTNEYLSIPSGSKYEPILSARTPSRGRVSRVWGNKTARQHVLLSDLERNYFVIAEYSDYVVDIREQFPMLKEQTESIAAELGISHPRDPKSKNPIIMTSDFCLTVDIDGEHHDIIRTIKPSDELLKKRVVEKYEIERIYWQRQGVDWGIVTEKEIDRTTANNIWWFRDCFSLKNDSYWGQLAGKSVYLSYVQAFIKIILNEDESICDNIMLFERNMGLQPGTAMPLYKHLLATKFITTDLTTKIDTQQSRRYQLNRSLMQTLLIGEAL